MTAMNPVVAEFIRQRQIVQKPFPLRALLVLYSKDTSHSLYLNYFEGFKLLVKWLAPIDCTSRFKPREIIQPLYTYEQQEIARILNLHPSIIQQEILDLWTKGFVIYPTAADSCSILALANSN